MIILKVVRVDQNGSKATFKKLFLFLDFSKKSKIKKLLHNPFFNLMKNEK
jgi:hypothetical protein